MKRHTLATLVFAALLGVSAQAQIITNYGSSTYVDGPWNGSWNGTTGNLIGTGKYAAQTFTTGSSGSSTLYAYNLQLNLSNASSAATFTTAVYAWSSGANAGSGILSAPSLVEGTQKDFVIQNNSGFNPFGNNFSDAGGILLSPNTVYAIVLARTDSGTGIGSIVQYGYDTTGGTYQVADGVDYILGDPGVTATGQSNGSLGDYVAGGLYTSTNGTNFSRSGGVGAQDMAFWISFSSQSLSPVPEPAVSGMMIGGALVVGFIAIRRFRNKSSSLVTPAV